MKDREPTLLSPFLPNYRRRSIVSGERSYPLDLAKYSKLLLIDAGYNPAARILGQSQGYYRNYRLNIFFRKFTISEKKKKNLYYNFNINIVA